MRHAWWYSLLLAGAMGSFGCFRDTGIEVLPVSSTQVSVDNLETLVEGTDATARTGDYILQNNDLQVVLNGSLGSVSRDLFLPKSHGAIIDFATQFEQFGSRETRPRDDDGLNQISQGVNMNAATLIGYDRVQISQEQNDSGSLILTGGVYDLDGSLEAAGAVVDSTTRRVADCEVSSVYQMDDLVEIFEGNEDPATFMTMTTVISNTGTSPLPIQTINDLFVTTPDSYFTFVPYPDWGFEQAADGSHAYPYFVHFQPRQSNTTQYAVVSRVEELLQVNRSVSDRYGEITYIGKTARGRQAIAPGEQLTYIREVMGLNSNTNLSNTLNRNIAYLSYFNLIAQNPSAESPYSHLSRFAVDFTLRGSPGSQVVFEYINESVEYFNGTSFVPLEAGRTYPFFGDSPISPVTSLGNSYNLLIPVGQIAISAKAQNSDPFYIDRREDPVLDDDGNVVLDDDGNPVTEPVFFILPEVEERTDPAALLGNFFVDNIHESVTIGLEDPDDRALLGRISVDRTDGGDPVFQSLNPGRSQGRFGYINTPNGSLVLMPVGTYDLFVSRGPLFDVQTQPVVIAVDPGEGEPDDGNRQFNLTMEPFVPLSGYLSADFDVRTAGDHLGMVDRVQLMLFAMAEDLDVLFFADTNHRSNLQDIFDTLAITLGDFNGDLQSEVDSVYDELAYSRAVATIGRVQDSFPDRGRFALLNLPDDEQNPSLEVPILQSDPAEFYDRARALDPNVIIHVTRPRAPEGVETGFFNVISRLSGLPDGAPVSAENAFLQRTAETGSNTRWVDFDLLQVLSGNNYGEYLMAREDWFNLMLGNIYKPATGGLLTRANQRPSHRRGTNLRRCWKYRPAGQ